MEETDISERNKIIYPLTETSIEKSELYLIYKYEEKLKNGKMLDIGIGFGRTTQYFVKLCKEYVGIDYQQVPVDYCKEKFKHSQNVSFHVCDAKAMNIFDDNYFDVILFSSNGIDYASHNERMLILKEIKRVCSQNGIIYFSTHNLQCLIDVFSLKFSLEPRKFISFVLGKLFLIRLKRKNPGINDIVDNISDLDYAMFFDGAQNFKLYLYFISPDKQIEQLKKLEFKDIKVISLANGLEVKQSNDIKTLRDNSLYYFCRP